MARLAAIGEWPRVRGFALAGALVLEADDAASARSAWAALPADVEVVVLTPAAARAVGPAGAGPGLGPAGAGPGRPRLLPVVLP